jgi:hydroxymethylbilane synthase
MRIGTRGSELALTQARFVADRLTAELRGRQSNEQMELVVVSTAGDRNQAIGDKSRWVAALERSLLGGEIDVAVHSSKDVPGEIAAGTALVAFPSREDPRDVLCGANSLASTAIGSRVGTSSVRRAAQLLAIRDDLQIVEMRGNVDTRLRKLAEGEADVIVLAAAGLERLGRASEAGCVLEGLVPAPGQGALAVQARANDERARAITDPVVEVCVLAERAFAKALGASCATPLGARAAPASAGNELTLEGWIGLPDGSEWIADEITGSADSVGQALAARMTSVGALELLRRAEAMP